MSETQPPDYGPPTILDYWEILRLPVLFALIAIAGTWAVWYLTSASCPPELAQTTGCNPGRVAQYINIDALNKIVTHALVGGGGGGLWSYAMITRERRAREAAERQLAEERQRADQERQRADEERQRADAERQRVEEERQRANEERQRANEERQQADAERQQADAERQQADAERRLLLARIEELEARQNGHSGPADTP